MERIRLDDLDGPRLARAGRHRRQLRRRPSGPPGPGARGGGGGARGRADRSVVLTFDPHPSRVLSPDRAPASLMTLDQKAEVLAGLGVDRLAVLPFTRELSELRARGVRARGLAEALGARPGGRGLELPLRPAAARATWRGSTALGRGLGLRRCAAWTRSGTRARPSAARGSARRWPGARSAPAARPARPALLRGRRAWSAATAAAATIGIPTANLELRERDPAAAGGLRRPGAATPDGAERPRAVVNLGRRPDLRGARDDRSRPTSWTSTGTSTGPPCAWSSWSGCATSGASPGPRPCSSRSGTTSGRTRRCSTLWDEWSRVVGTRYSRPKDSEAPPP